MNKRELLEKLAPLADDDDIIIALTAEKEDNGFTIGEAEETSDSSDDDEDSSVIDNEDGTETELYPIDEIDIETFNDEETGLERKVAFIRIDFTDEDDDSDEEDGDNNDND